MFRLHVGIVSLCVLLGTTQCGSFYTLYRKDIAQQGNPAVQVPPGSKHPYVTVVVHNHLEPAFFQSRFRAGRKTNLSHLYIHAEYQEPSAEKPREWPLYLLDFSKATIDQAERVEFSKWVLPYDGQGSPSRISLQAAALEQPAVVEAIWSRAKPLLRQASTSTLGSAGGLAVDALSGLLERLAGAKEFRYRKTLPGISLQADTTSGVMMYLLVPTESDGTVKSSALKEITDKALHVEWKNGSPVVYDGAKPYEEWPYLLVEYALSDYLTLPGLLPPVFDPSCAVVSAEALQRATEVLQASRSSLSPEQTSLEMDLHSRLKLYVQERDAMQAWGTNEYADAKRRALRLDAINAYVAYRTQALRRPEDHNQLYKERFKQRLEILDQCVEQAARVVPFYNSMEQVVTQLLATVHSKTPALDETDKEGRLSVLYPILSWADRVRAQQQGVDTNLADEAGPVLKGSLLYSQVVGQIAILEEQLYRTYYQSKVERLNSTQPSKAGDQLKAELLRRVPRLQCQSCKKQILLACQDYEARQSKPGAPGSQLVDAVAKVASSLQEARTKRASEALLGTYHKRAVPGDRKRQELGEDRLNALAQDLLPQQEKGGPKQAKAVKEALALPPIP